MAGDDDVRDGAAAPGPSGPAPIIDLGGDAVPVRPVKPLGPRRLARLQRELAERSRELEELGGQPAGPELLEKQRRFAELAAEAAAANAPSDAVASAPTEAAEPGASASGTPERPVALEPGPAEPVEQITVVFPDSAGPDGTDTSDPVHVDPALFTNRLAPEELAALTHIEVLSPGGPAQPGSTAPEQTGPGRGVPAEATATPPPAETGPGRGLPAEEAAAPSPTADPEEEPDPPAPPVPATRAGGLELLEPGEYRSGSRVAVVVLAAVLAAAVVLLVLLVL